MRVGFYATGSATADYADLLDQVVWAEQAGFASAWLRERHFHRDHHGRNFFSAPMVAAAWIAARTERLRIGLGARILPLDHPLHVAEAAATIDVISRGRLDLGVARIGENDLYERAYGIDPEESRSRFEEALEVIERAWSGEPFAYSGRYYTVPPVALEPTPVQRPGPPVYLVALSPETVALGARRGLPLLLAAAQPEAEVERTVTDYRERLAAAGHDPLAAAMQLNRFVYVAETTEQARRELAPAIDDFLNRPASVIRDFLGARAARMSTEMLLDEVFVCGDAAYCAERLRRLAETLRVDHVLLTFNYFTLSHERCRGSMERFAADALPLLSEEALAAR